LTGSTPANISATVAIQANRASIWVSGTSAPVRMRSLPLGARRWFGDTKVQAGGVATLVNPERLIEVEALPSVRADESALMIAIGRGICYCAAGCERELAKEAYATTWQEEEGRQQERITKEFVTKEFGEP
jgi:hypothetical protein